MLWSTLSKIPEGVGTSHIIPIHRFSPLYQIAIPDEHRQNQAVLHKVPAQMQRTQKIIAHNPVDDRHGFEPELIDQDHELFG
jgi:hypothetical protein